MDTRQLPLENYPKKTVAKVIYELERQHILPATLEEYGGNTETWSSHAVDIYGFYAAAVFLEDAYNRVQFYFSLQ